MNKVSWDHRKIARLRVDYNAARAAGKEIFMSDGLQFLVPYARYLLDYFDNTFLRVSKDSTVMKGKR